MKLANPLKSHEIAGRSYQFGRLTIGIGVELEAYLKTLPTEIEQVESSGILKSVPQEVATSIASDLLQRHDVYPPDAITSLYEKRNLLNSTFCYVLVKAALKQYNPGIPSSEIDSIANMATHQDATRIAMILAGADDIDPKDVAVPEVEAAKVAN